MHRVAVIISILVGLLSNSALPVVCSGETVPDSSMSGMDDMNVPDCCRNGICPYHRAHPPAPRTPESDCTCHMSSGATLMVGTGQTPAIYCEADFGVVRLQIEGSIADAGITRLLSPEIPIFTPPPRS